MLLFRHVWIYQITIPNTFELVKGDAAAQQRNPDSQETCILCQGKKKLSDSIILMIYKITGL